MDYELQNIEGVRRRSKRGFRKTSDYKSEVIKRARVEGKAYTNYKGNLVAERVPGEDCRCRRKCYSLVSEEERLLMYTKFISHVTKNEQDSYLQSLVSCKKVKQRRKRILDGSSSKPSRGTTYCYELTGSSGKVQVCKKTFINIHGITAERVRRLSNLLSQGKAPIDKRGKSTPGNAKPGSVVEAVKEHIKQFPVKISRYSSRQYMYLNEKLNVKLMHAEFNSKYPNLGVNYQFYISVFKRDFDLKFGRPQIDTCCACEALDIKIKSKVLNDVAKRVAIAEKMVHIKRAKKFYASLTEVTEKVKSDTSGKIGAIAIDFMQNLSLPKIPVQEIFYLRQLTINVFCIHNLKDDTAMFYLYHEGVGGKGPNEVCSFVFQYITNYMVSVEHLHIFSDGCGGQNKNHTMVRMCSALVSIGTFKTINQYYPFRGHSFLACDRDFAIVKKKIKTRDRVYTIKEYAELILSSSQNSNKFAVTLPDSDQIIDFKRWWPKFYKKNMLSTESRGKNIKKEDKISLKISQLKHFLHSHDYPVGTMIAKEYINGLVSHTFPLRNTTGGLTMPQVSTYPILKRAINNKKMNDLKKIEEYLPDNRIIQNFYKTIFSWEVCDNEVHSDYDENF